jgi:hypothetical protein
MAELSDIHPVSASLRTQGRRREERAPADAEARRPRPPARPRGKDDAPEPGQHVDISV